MLKIHNTLSQNKQEFKPIEPGKIRMYVCGITIYDYSHIGHARTFVAFDVIKTTRSRIHQNIGWALLYNAIAIPLAITGLLNPLFAALAMASSSILVVWNSSRSVMNKEFQQVLLKGNKNSVNQLPA